MFFAWDITIPADTTEKSPIEDFLSLPKGIITQIDIKFPRGCHGMVKVRLFQESLQVVPLSEDEWVTGDGETVPTSTVIELLDAPYKLKLHACSPDTTYDHKVSIRINVLPEEYAGVARLTRLVETLLEALGIEVLE